MRFTSIEIENLLAYRGTSRLDLPEPKDGKNVVLIWGRNGMGKTSFLTALKLLFTGIEEQHARRVGISLNSAHERSYVLGDQHWFGLFNRRALEEAKRSKHRVTARVSAKWIDRDRMYHAERSWTTDGQTYQHQLVVFDGEDRFVGNAAEQRLGEILPRSFVGFFFFDGEEVKELAEGLGHRAVDVNGLLRLTFANRLAETLHDVARARVRGATEASLRTQIDEAERELARARRNASGMHREIRELDELLSDASKDLTRLHARREDLGSGASEATQVALEEKKNIAKDEFRHAIEAIADKLPPLVPFYANFGLLREALGAVDTRLKAANKPDTILIRKIREKLPSWIEMADAGLSGQQSSKIVTSVEHGLEELHGHGGNLGQFAGLSLERAEQLQALLLRWTIAGPAERDLQALDLNRAWRSRAELEQIEEQLMRLAVGTQADIEEYRQIVDRIATLEKQSAEWNQRKGQLAERAKDHDPAIAKFEKTLRDLRDQQERVVKNSDEARFIRQLARSLEQYRDRLRTTVKDQLESSINTHFFELSNSHNLVSKITLTDNYLMNFLDSNDRPVARGSLSAGLKQLAATALLWSMKEVSKHEFPVVIDTPLGRIDRENQENLLQNYYPRVADQVIVLPTNSEIDSRKLSLLNDHVLRHFIINNVDGDQAQILPDRQLVGLAS